MISYLEIFRTALQALKRNKTRSILTTLGIIIGVGAVIAAFAVGNGANKVIDDQIASLGSNFLIVMPDRAAASSTGVTRYLTVSDADEIAKTVSGIDAVAPMINTSAQVIYGNTNWTTDINGSAANFSSVKDFTIRLGRDLNPGDIRQANKVAVIGSTVATKLFGDKSPLNEVIRIKKVPFTIVGVFAQKGQSTGGQDQDDFVLVPLTSAQRRLVHWVTPGRISDIFIKGVSMTALSYIESETTLLLRERHRIKPGQPDDFAIRNISQMLEARRKTTAVMSMLLAAIAVISLVVGGIGIMNIMLVSVTERTREIGIRMAVGAKSYDIQLQFLIEAVTLSLLGGALGVAAGVGAGWGLGRVTQAPPIFTWGSVALAFVFSAMVGIGFGFYPAWKASQLNPIDALKYE